MADELKTEVQIVGDTSDLQTQLVAAKGQLQGLESQLRSTAAALAKAGIEEGAAARSMADLASRVTKARAGVQSIEGQLRDLASAARQAAGAAQSGGEQIAEGMERGTHATAGMSREVIVMAHEFITGRFSRIPGSVMVLTERMGGLGSAVTALKGPFGLAVAGAAALGGAFAYLAYQAIQAEKAMRGVYNARLLVGGGGAAGAETAAAAGAAAIRGTGLASANEANTYAAAVEKAGDLSAANAQKLMALGPALSQTMGGWEKATKFAEDTFKDTSAIEHYIEQMGLIAPGEEAAYEAAKKAGDGYRIQSIALDALTRQLSGASGAIAKAQSTTESIALGAAQAGIGLPFAGLVTRATLPHRMPEVPVGAAPVEVEQRLRWEQEYNQAGVQRAAIEQTIAEATAQRGKASSDAERAELDAVISGAKAKLAQLHAPGQGSAMQQLEAQLAQQNAAIAKQGGGRQQISQKIAQNEAQFWQKAAQDQSLSQQQRTEAATRAAEAQIQLAERVATAQASGTRQATASARKSYEDFAAAEREKLGAAQGNWNQQLAIINEWAAKAQAQFGATSRQYQQVMAEAARVHEGQAMAGVQKLQHTTAQPDDRALAAKKAQLQDEVDQDQLSKAQMLATLKEFVAQQGVAEMQAYQAFLATIQEYPKAYEAAWNEMVARAQRYTTEIAQINQQIDAQAKKAADAMVKSWGDAFDRIGDDISRTLTSAIFSMPRSRTYYKPYETPQGQWLQAPHQESGTTQLALGLGRQVATQLGTSITGALTKSLAQSLFGAGTKSMGEGIAKMIGIGQPGGLFGTGMFSLSQSTQVTSQTANTTALAALTSAVIANTAALTGAAATTATSAGTSAISAAGSAGGLVGGIKTVGGWIGGLFGFEGGGIVPSAAGGMVVPGATLAMLHAREMVLPAHLSQGIQRMIAGGGAGAHGGDTHLHFHGPADGPAIERFFTPMIRKVLPGLVGNAARSRTLWNPV